MDNRAYLELLNKEIKAYDPLLMAEESKNLVYLGRVRGQEIYAPEAVIILARRSQLKRGKVSLVEVFKKNELSLDGLLQWLYSRDILRRGTADIDEIDAQQKAIAERERKEDHEMNKDMARFILKTTGKVQTTNFGN